MKLYQKLLQGDVLTTEEASVLMAQITTGHYNDVQLSAMITTFHMRSLSSTELLGFQNELLERCMKIPLEDTGVIDLCGTGGDGKDTFNISTITAFVLAAMGYKVVKHGNNGVSSSCGSSNVLNALGYQFSKEPDQVLDELRRYGLSFIHAPYFHPALKEVAQVRKKFGIKSFFNILGPLVNPAQPDLQVAGVYDLRIARLYTQLLQKQRKAFSIVHTVDGYDELSLTAAAKIYGDQSTLIFQPSDLGVRPLRAEQLYSGGSIQSSAAIFQSIIRGKGTEAQNAVVAANTALAIHTINHDISLKEAYHNSFQFLQSGAATPLFERFIKTTTKSFAL
jgi:anthranilate phosphoribosyltransferase